MWLRAMTTKDRSMHTPLSDTFDLQFDGRDVLLFRHAADGTASLLAVTDKEWTCARAAEAQDAARVDTIRRLFADQFS